MTASTLDKQINNYLSQLNPKQKKAVLTVVKTFAEEHESLLDVPTFVDEMNRRSEELESGKIKGTTWEEVKKKAENSINKRK